MAEGSDYLFHGISQGAQAFAEGVREYHKNKQEDEFLGGQLEMLTKYAPEYGVQIDPEMLAKYSSGNLNAKRAAVTGLMTQITLKQKQAQIDEMKRYHDLQAGGQGGYAPHEAERLVEALHRAEAAGDTRAAEYYRGLMALKQMGPMGLDIEFDDQGRPKHIKQMPGFPQKGGKAEGDITTGTQSKLEQDLISYESPMATIAKLENTMRAGDVGLRGVVGDLSDKYLAQIKPDAADPQRVSVREAIKLLRSDLFKTLRSDSNITEKEREQIQSALPSLGADESLPAAMQKLADVKGKLVENARVRAGKLNKPMPVWAMTPEEVAEALVSGKLTEEQAAKAIQQYHPSFK